MVGFHPLKSNTDNLSFLRLRLVVVAAAVAAAAASPTIPLAAKAMYNPELFQGDIKGIAGQEPGVRKDSFRMRTSREGWQRLFIP